jgi:hypothetical protein
MGEISELGWLIGLVEHAMWSESLYFLYLLLHVTSCFLEYRTTKKVQKNSVNSERNVLIFSKPDLIHRITMSMKTHVSAIELHAFCTEASGQLHAEDAFTSGGAEIIRTFVGNCPPTYILVFLVVSFLLAFPPISYMHSSSHPFVLHSLSISFSLT